jgi:hypothetical protein
MIKCYQLWPYWLRKAISPGAAHLIPPMPWEPVDMRSDDTKPRPVESQLLTR